MDVLERYKHISFDLDGTLVHTTPEYRHRVVPAVVRELGGVVKEKHHIDHFWFEPGRDTTIREYFNLEPERFWKLFHKMDAPEERSLHTRAYDDAEPAIRGLKSSGKIVSIITGSPDWIAQMEIGKLNNAPYDFYLAISYGGFDQKPDPKSFHFVLDKLKTSPKETLYIGNSNEDAYFAKNAGVDFLYLERKEHPFDLKDYAIGTIHSLEEMFEYLVE